MVVEDDVGTLLDVAPRAVKDVQDALIAEALKEPSTSTGTTPYNSGLLRSFLSWSTEGASLSKGDAWYYGWNFLGTMMWSASCTL
jgi:hypothetical protein